MNTRYVTVEGRTILRELIEARSLQLASGLVAQGVKEGDVIAVFMRNRQAYLEIILACRRLGVYYCPVNWHFTAQEVQYILSDSDACLVMTESDLLSVAQAANINRRTIICAATNHCLQARQTEGLNDEVLDYDAWLESFQCYDGPLVSPRGHMAYTSGTTGRPKGVVRAAVPIEKLTEHQAQLGKLIEQAYGLRFGVRALLPAPIYHSAPSLFCQMALLRCEHFVVTDRFDPEQLLCDIERYRIEVVYMVPIMYVRLLRLDPAVRARYDISSLKFVASTGAPCPPDIKRQMIEWFGPVLYETYASSEAGLITLATSEDAITKPATAGRPVETAEIKILNTDGVLQPVNSLGLIYVRNTSYADFTYRNRHEERLAIERDGFITLGDIGYLDRDGYLFVCDRETDMILSGGVNVYPAEIEHVLVGYPGVLDCTVIGMPDDEFGQRLLGVIETQDGGALDVPALTQWLSKYLAGYKIPKSYAFTSELPRDLNGKISRSKVRQAFLKRR